MTLLRVSLEDKYTKDTGRIYLNGTQALVRLTLMQYRRDLAQGMNTAGYVSGYRGSPLGGIDKEFSAANVLLKEHQVTFHPAVNEDLAATAVWGTQQTILDPETAIFDGVFSMWYGKGPGVDRSGDVFRHSNMAGTSPYGGVLALAGDDPSCKSSTVPSQSEYAFIDAQIPLLYPANTQEVLDFGILGWAMSRYSGCWTGMKCISDNVDSSASVEVDPHRIKINIPPDFNTLEGGVHIRWPDQPMEAEARLHKYKIPAALAFARHNQINKLTLDSTNPKFGIISTGKSYLDTLQALNDLQIDETEANRLGLRLLKIGMPWPLEKKIIREFCEGLQEVLIIEEKRPVIESQVKEQLYNLNPKTRPRVIGKQDETDEWILPSAGELSPNIIARVIAGRLKKHGAPGPLVFNLGSLNDKDGNIEKSDTDIARIPYFCSGCPHNTSTKVPEGSKAAAGIGCHYMAIWMDRKTETFTHMGGEGANWIGRAPFSKDKHIFVNIGDGTYFHSGILAIRAAVASGVNVTYKVLYNDAVAMTGGQSMDGPLNPSIITRQVAAEGVEHIALASDEPEKYPMGTEWAPGVTFHHRRDLDALQRDFRERPGVSVIVYDQTCAAEKRRRRKRGMFPDPQKRAFINHLVCEGCGDCGQSSNCVSITPKETIFGRKRLIDQSACNKDFSCIDGFCPSFVTVHGVEPRKLRSSIPDTQEVPFPAIPAAPIADATEPYSIVISGIGGTGVVTISALLAMAAHMMNKGVTTLDMAGLAQKNGAVHSHVRICNHLDKLHAVRITDGGADALIGCDMLTSGSHETLFKLKPGHTHAVVNGQHSMTADFTRNPDLEFPEDRLRKAIHFAIDGCDPTPNLSNVHFVEATTLARGLMGDTIGANLFLVGYALQKGLLPVTEQALHAAIDLNGVAPEFNKRALLWGRRAGHDLASVHKVLNKPSPEIILDKLTNNEAFEAYVQSCANELKIYQNVRYANTYMSLIAEIANKENDCTPGRFELRNAAAKALFKVMAIKDEYEVGRLFTDGRFESAIRKEFEDGAKLTFHLAPPLLAKHDPVTGHLLKREYGPWVFKALKVLAALKNFRETPLDIFGQTKERKAERSHRDNYIRTLRELMNGLCVDNHEIAVEIACLPLSVRGFGHIWAKNHKIFEGLQTQLLKSFSEYKAIQTAAE